jgi:hypothetical protein
MVSEFNAFAKGAKMNQKRLPITKTKFRHFVEGEKIEDFMVEVMTTGPKKDTYECGNCGHEGFQSTT